MTVTNPLYQECIHLGEEIHEMTCFSIMKRYETAKELRQLYCTSCNTRFNLFIARICGCSLGVIGCITVAAVLTMLVINANDRPTALATTVGATGAMICVAGVTLSGIFQMTEQFLSDKHVYKARMALERLHVLGEEITELFSKLVKCVSGFSIESKLLPSDIAVLFIFNRSVFESSQFESLLYNDKDDNRYSLQRARCLLTGKVSMSLPHQKNSWAVDMVSVTFLVGGIVATAAKVGLAAGVGTGTIVVLSLMCVTSATVLFINILQAAEMLAKYCKDEINFGIVTKAVELEESTTSLLYATVGLLTRAG